MTATDGLPMPREHFRATTCAECPHLRSEHVEDGICDRCDCVKFTRIAIYEMLSGIDMGLDCRRITIGDADDRPDGGR